MSNNAWSLVLFLLDRCRFVSQCFSFYLFLHICILCATLHFGQTRITLLTTISTWLHVAVVALATVCLLSYVFLVLHNRFKKKQYTFICKMCLWALSWWPSIFAKILTNQLKTIVTKKKNLRQRWPNERKKTLTLSPFGRISALIFQFSNCHHKIMTQLLMFISCKCAASRVVLFKFLLCF